MLRYTPPRKGDPSPWGLIDHVDSLGPDAVVVSTPSHGGLWVSPAALERIPEPLRETAYSGCGWFEEDCDWCIPYLALALHQFEPDPERGRQNLEAAQRTFRGAHGALDGLLSVEATAHARERARG